MSAAWLNRLKKFFSTGRRRRSFSEHSLEQLESRHLLTPALVGGVVGADLGPVDINSDIKLTFTEPIQRGTAGEIRLFHQQGRLIEAFAAATDSRLSLSGSTLTIDPTWDLDGSAGYYLQFDAGSLRGTDGSSVSGITDESTLAFRSGVEVLQVSEWSSIRDEFPGTASEAIGNHRALYMRVTFPDVNRAPNSQGSAEADMAMTGQAYIDSSRGRMPVTTTYTPVITVPFSYDWLSTFDLTVNGLGLLQSAAQAEAVKLGYRMDEYDVRIVRVDKSLRSGASWGGGDSVWLAWGGASVIVHEAGHALGFGHAKSTDFSGTDVEYGNSLDWMGNGGSLADVFGIRTQTGIGWTESTDILTDPGSGVYRLHGVDSGRNVVGQYYGLSQKIAADSLGADPVYTFEFRPRQGDSLRDAVVLLRNGKLIDLTPGTSGGFLDGGIRLGQTYQIPGSTARVSVVNAGADYVDVNLELGSFSSNVAPSVSFSASATTARRFDPVTFSASAVDADGDELLYEWTFGDGVRGTGPVLTRAFHQSAAQSVTVSLVVTDRRGGKTTVTGSIAVAAASTGTPAAFGSTTSPVYALPSVSIIATDKFAAEGGDVGSVQVSRLGTSTAQPLTVALSYSGTALSMFSGLPATVVIPAGESSVSFSVQPSDDTAVQSLRALDVSVTASSDYVISGQNGQARISVNDNDTPVVTIVATDALASEGVAPDRNTGTFLIRRTGPLDQPLKVYYGLIGTAQNGGDFGRLDGQVVIGAGQDSVSIVINPLDDTIGESPETVILTLAAFGDTYSVGEQFIATVTINDESDLPTVNVRASGSRVEEGGTGQVTFEVIGGDGSALWIPYTVSGTATSGVDYAAQTGLIQVPAGKGTRTAVLSLVSTADGVQEDDETIVVSLSASANSQFGVDRSAVVQIADVVDLTSGQDRVSVSRHFSGSAALPDVSESTGSPLSFWVTRQNSTADRTAVTVNFALQGTATPGVDYTGVVRNSAGVQLSTFTPAATNAVTIPADQAGVIVDLVPVVDSVVEGTETVVFSLESATSGALWIPRAVNRQVSVVLLDSDAAPVKVRFASLASVVGEPLKSSWAKHTLDVSLSQAAAQAVTVDYAAAGGAALAAGGDWAFEVPVAGSQPSTSGTLTFAPGEVTKTISVWIQADRIPESAESFDVRLQYPRGASLDSTGAVHRVSVYDNVPDGLVTEERWSGTAVYDNNTWASVSPFYQGFLNGLTTAQNVADSYSRRLTGYITAPVTGDYTFYVAADDAAKLYLSSTDSAANKSLVASLSNWTAFQQWDKYSSQKSAVITLTAGQRYYIEVLQKDVGGGDHVSVGWQRPGDTSISPISTIMPVAGSDNHYVQFAVTSTSLVEGGTGEILVTLDRPSETAVTAVLTATGGVGVTGADFSTGSLTVTFAPGELSRVVSFTAVADSTAESLERVSLKLANASGARINSPAEHVVSITDAAAPVITATTGYVVRGQANGAEVMQLNAVAAAGRSISTWEILAGNPVLEGSSTPAFAVDATGRLTIANTNALPFVSMDLALVLRVTDSQGASAIRTVSVVANGRSILEERWEGSTPYNARDFSAQPVYVGTLSEFDAARDVADSYSRRVQGIFTPAVSGDYSFWIAARDAGRLTIAPFSDPTNEVDLATSGDAAWQAWDSADQQQSAPQSLTAGQRYILRAYQVEGIWGDHLSVAWSGPGFSRQVMPGSAFLPAFPTVPVARPALSDSTPPAATAYSISTTALTNTGTSGSISAGQFTKDATLGFTGTAQAGSVVRVYADQTLVGQTVALRSGTWSVTAATLADGIYQFRAEVVDEQGNVGITAPVSFEVRTKIEVDNFALLTTGSGDAKWTTSGAAVSSTAGVSLGDQGVVVYSVTNGSVSDLMATDGVNGNVQLVTRGPASATVSAGVSTTYAGISNDASLVLFGTNSPASFGTGGTAFTDENQLQSGSYSDLLGFNRATGEVQLLTYGSGSSTTRSRQAQMVGVTSDSRFVVFTTDYVEQIGNFTAPGKAQPAKWELVAGGFPTTAGKTKVTTLRVADIDPTLLTLAMSGGYITNKPLTASVSTTTIVRSAGTLSFWVQGLDGTTTKAVKLELTDVATGILVKAVAAKYTSGNQPNFNWNTSGTAGQVASSNGGAGYAVSVLEVVGGAQTSKMLAEGAVASRDVVAYDVLTGQLKLLSHSATAGNTASGAAGVSGVTLSGDGRHVLFTANDASKFGNAGVAFTDSSPSTADIFAVDVASGEIRLLSHGPTGDGVSAGVAATLVGVSPDGGSAVFSAADAGVFGFTDIAPAVTDLFAVDFSTGAIRQISHSGTSTTTSMGQAVVFEKVAGGGVFFAAADATKAGFSADANTASNDLLRFDLTTGGLQLISHAISNTQQALNGVFKAGSVTVSPNGRFVAFASGLPSSSAGFTVSVSGDALFLADLQTGAIRLLNGNNAEGTRLSYGAWAGIGNQTSSPRFFTPDSQTLVWQTSYMGWITVEDRSFGAGVDSQYGTSVLAFDLSGGVPMGGTVRYSRVLSHTAASINQIGLSVTLRGVTGDSRTAIFTSTNATSFGNDGVAFTDTAVSAADIFAVDLASRRIRLLSGADGASFGQAATFQGVTQGSAVIFGVTAVDGMPSLAGTLTDSNGPGTELVTSRLRLLDLADADDTVGNGTNTDNITSKRSFSLTSWAPPGRTVQLLDNGTSVGTQTAPANGRLTWSLTNVTVGVHEYSLWFGAESIPFIDSSDSSASTLTVTVTGNATGPSDIGLSGQSLAENSGADATVGTLSTVSDGSGETFTYSLVSGEGGTDNAKFSISGSTLRMVSDANYESQSSYSIRVRSTTTGGQFVEKSFVILVTNVNEAPTTLSLSSYDIAENSGASALVGNFSTTDPDSGDTFTYELVAGAGDMDNGLFTVSGGSLRAQNSFNFEAQSSYSVRVRSTDQGGLTTVRVLTIAVTNVNESPTDIQLSTSSIAENAAASATVGQLSSVDPDAGDTFTYSLVTGTGDTDNARFVISGGELRAVSAFNYEAKNSYSIRLRSTDAGGLQFDRITTITVLDVNEQPTDLSLTSTIVNENQPVGTVVGALNAVDPDAGNTFTWTLVAGTGSTNNASFSILGSQLRTQGVFDFESKSSYSVRVRAADQGGLWFEKAVVITVGNVDDTNPTSSVQNVATPTSRVIPISVTATDPGLDATGVARVDLYYSTGGAYVQFGSVTPADLSTTWTVPAANTTYWLRSLAVDVAGNSESKTGYDVAVTVGDVDLPVTQVTSVTVDDYGKAVVQMTGTRDGRAKLQEFVLYGTIDGGAVTEIGRVSAGVANGSGVYSAEMVLQLLADNATHSWTFYSVGIDSISSVEAAPSTPDATLNRSFTPPPLRALDIDVQLGMQQRSFVRYLDVLFSEASGVSNLGNASRVKVEKFSVDTASASSAVAGTGTNVVVSAFTTVNSRLRLDFGSSGVGGLRQAGDGFYRIRIDMDGDAAFGGADDAEFEFFRLFGDVNGDGIVTLADTNLVGSQLGRTGSGLEADCDGNGVVNTLDRQYSIQRRNRTLQTWMFGWLDD